MRCPHCGYEDPEDFAFCSECGQPRVPTPTPFQRPPGYPPAGPSGFGPTPPPPNVPMPPLPPPLPPMPPPGYQGPPTPGIRPPYGASPSLAEGRIARLTGIEGPVEGQ